MDEKKLVQNIEANYIYNLYHGLEKPDFGKYIEEWEI